MATKSTPRKRASSTPKAAITIPHDSKRKAPSGERNSRLMYEYRMDSPRGALYLMRDTTYNYYDEEKNKVRGVRYCEGETSIFVDEQSENPVKTPLTFKMGVMVVPKSKPNLIEFLDKHPGNRANGGNKFHLVDYVAKKQASLDEEFVAADAIVMLRTKPVEELLMVATAYGMNTDREFAEIKHDLLQKAKVNPAGFMKSFDDPSVKMKSKINSAVNYQIIKLDDDAVRWFDTGQQIISVPAGMDPLNVFVRYCLTEKAVPIVEEIDKQLQ